MLDRNASRFRTPGPLGLTAGVSQGRLPGPLGLAAIVLAGPAALKLTTKKLKMPRPNDALVKRARKVTWKLYKDDRPALDDVEQGSLSNCPLAALLAALAYTPTGRSHIKKMVQEHHAKVETDISAVAAELDSEGLPKGKIFKSSRYFTVRLAGKSYEVSDVFYTNDGDGDSWSLIYMTSPKKALWPCVIEKAYAEMEGGYDKLDSMGLDRSLEDVWEAVVGKRPTGFAVDTKTPKEKIRLAARNAETVPTVAASRAEAKKLMGWHGHALLGMRGSIVKLYDPFEPAHKEVSLKTFREEIEAIRHGSPSGAR